MEVLVPDYNPGFGPQHSQLILYADATGKSWFSASEHKEMWHHTVNVTVYCQSNELEVIQTFMLLTDGGRKLIQCRLKSDENLKN